MTTIRFERDGAIGNIVLANPPFNRLDLRFAEALRSAVRQASESDIRVLVVRAEGPHFSFGGEVREWPGRDINWFRTFVADVNVSYRAIETLKIARQRQLEAATKGDPLHYRYCRYFQRLDGAIGNVHVRDKRPEPVDVPSRPFPDFASETEMRALRPDDKHANVAFARLVHRDPQGLGKAEIETVKRRVG